MKKKCTGHKSTKHIIYPSLSTKGSFYAIIQGVGVPAILPEKKKQAENWFHQFGVQFF